MPQVEQYLYNRYQLKQKLGQDASRQTWLAIDTKTQPPESVVVKLLAFDPEMQWEESKLFEREAQVLQTLDHPRIPQYRNYFTLDQLPDSRFPWFGLVQSYIPGESLQALIDRHQRFTPAQVEKIAIEVLSILIYLHELDPPMLHRDIKPSNLIWGTDDRIYLVDFGAVQHQAATEGATFTVVGTYGYVPIEQFGGHAVPASDLYALGATLIHLITGLAAADLPQHDGRIQFTDRTSLDSGLVKWLSKLIEPNLGDRFSTAREALTAFDQRHALSEPTTTPKPSGSKIQIRKSANQLEIKTPPRGRQSYNLVALFGVASSIAVVIAIFGFALSVASDPIGFGFSLFMFVIFITISPILLSAFHSLLSPMFQQTSLDFTRQYLVIQHRLLGICYKRDQIRIEDIDRISAGEDLEEGLRKEFELRLKVYASKRSKSTMSSNLLGEGLERNLQHGIAVLSERLVIQAGKKTYSTNPLSKVERLWLQREIEDWLQQAQQIPNDS